MSLADTAPDARRRQLAIYRLLTPERRVEMAFAMSEEAVRLTVDGIRARQPNLGEDGVRRELFRVLHGRRLADAVVGASPDR